MYRLVQGGNPALAKKVLVLAVQMDLLPATGALLAALRTDFRLRYDLPHAQTLVFKVRTVAQGIADIADEAHHGELWPGSDLSVLMGALDSSRVLEQAVCTMLMAEVQHHASILSAVPA
jgi:hypothetical protein